MNFVLGRKCVEETAQCADQVLHFELGGLHLQEPMALVTNLMIAAVCFFSYVKLKKRKTNEFSAYWTKFMIFFGISTIFGGLGHLFFQYFGTPGKFPCWTLGFVASFLATKSYFVSPLASDKTRNIVNLFVWIKTIILLGGAMIFQNFIFIIIDSAITYLFIGGFMSFKFYKKGMLSFKFHLLAIALLIPPAFIFLMKLNLHDWFNKDDLSHMFMMGTIFFFYLGAKDFSKYYANRSV